MRIFRFTLFYSLGRVIKGILNSGGGAVQFGRTQLEESMQLISTISCEIKTQQIDFVQCWSF